MSFVTKAILHWRRISTAATSLKTKDLRVPAVMTMHLTQRERQNAGHPQDVEYLEWPEVIVGLQVLVNVRRQRGSVGFYGLADMT